MVTAARQRVIVALDVPSASQSADLIDQLSDIIQWFNVCLELYISEGNKVIDSIRKRNCSVFLDLKLHDIPNTVAGAVRSASRAGAQMLTLHAGGGAAISDSPKLLAVTVLTSLDQTQLQAVGVPGLLAEQVARRQDRMGRRDSRFCLKRRGGRCIEAVFPRVDLGYFPVFDRRAGQVMIRREWRPRRRPSPQERITW